jgi:pseudaminic acid synthase
MKIGTHPIGVDHPPFIVAEMSGNHAHSLDRALALVEAAARAGVQALKLQTYTADTMTLDIPDREFVIDDPNSLWNGTSLYDLYKKAYTPWEWHEPIFRAARERGLVAFSTPFDETAVEFLETLEVPCFKIAAFENTDIPLIRRVAATGKPLFISTGMATEDELAEAVQAARDAGCQDMVLLKCTSTYPASPEQTHLRTLPVLRERFGCEVGLSDHTLGLGASVAAVALGATVIERHFTLRRDDGAVDSAFSLMPEEMRMLVEEARRAWQALGGVHFGPTESERASLKHRRSLYIVKDLAAGEVLTRDNVRAIRPGLGLPPKFLDQVLGRPVLWSVKRGTPMTWSIVQDDGEE